MSYQLIDNNKKQTYMTCPVFDDSHWSVGPVVACATIWFSLLFTAAAIAFCILPTVWRSAICEPCRKIVASLSSPLSTRPSFPPSNTQQVPTWASEITTNPSPPPNDWSREGQLWTTSQDFGTLSHNRGTQGSRKGWRQGWPRGPKFWETKLSAFSLSAQSRFASAVLEGVFVSLLFWK